MSALGRIGRSAGDVAVRASNDANGIHQVESAIDAGELAPSEQ